MKLKEIRDEKRAGYILKALNSRNITAFFVKTKDKALKKVLELTSKNSSISQSGSISIKEIGLTEVLKKEILEFLIVMLQYLQKKQKI